MTPIGEAHQVQLMDTNQCTPEEWNKVRWPLPRDTTNPSVHRQTDIAPGRVQDLEAEQGPGSQPLSSPQPTQPHAERSLHVCMGALTTSPQVKGNPKYSDAFLERSGGRGEENPKDLVFPNGTELTKKTKPLNRKKLKWTQVYFFLHYLEGTEGWQ